MKLSYLLAKLGIEPGYENENVTCITDLSDNITENCIFVCIKGNKSDGHSFVGKALSERAAAVIGEDDINPKGYFKVADSRLAFAVLCSAFYGEPDKKLRIIGITGTNGKTTTAEYVRFILNNTGHKCGIIGTNGYCVNDGYSETGFTTPPSDLLYKSLDEMRAENCEFCVAEVSSQALSQKRCDLIHFETGVFTNLGNEHLDYHKTPQQYINAKGHLAELSDRIIVNADDAYCEKFVSFGGNKPVKYYSARHSLADYMANDIRYENGNVSFVLISSSGVERIKFKGIGEFSVYNALTAAAVCIEAGVPFAEVTALINKLPGVSGRAQMFTSENGINVCVDFAHTPEAMSNILSALEKTTSGSIITVFGCGGERDKTKRQLMGRIASNMSKTVILTADNSRSEKTEEIIDDIKSGIRRKTDVFSQPDREKAIRLALNKASPGDTVLVAGRGNENVLHLPEGEIHFNDIECIKNII